MENTIGMLNGLRIGSLVSGSNVMNICLAAGEIFRVEAERHEVLITCKGGALWITQDKDPQDHILRSGEQFLAGYHGRMLVSGLPNGEVQFAAR